MFNRHGRGVGQVGGLGIGVTGDRVSAVGESGGKFARAALELRESARQRGGACGGRVAPVSQGVGAGLQLGRAVGNGL